MTDKTLPRGTVELYAYHHPSITSGNYTISVTQELKHQKITKEEGTFKSYDQHFSVLGPRFSLTPIETYRVFPPVGSLGEHSHVLPHIALNRSTLPWERSAVNGDTSTPWLALLIFHSDELSNQLDSGADLNAKVTLQSMSLGACREKKPEIFKNLEKEFGQMDDDTVSILEIDKTLARKILPKRNELGLLSHVRRSRDGDGKLRELSIVIGNRLPKYGTMTTAHLVSMEGRYSNSSEEFPVNESAGKVALVSLKSWTFSCISEKHDLPGLFKHLNHELIISTKFTGTIPNDGPALFHYLTRTVPAISKIFISTTYITPKDPNNWYITHINRMYLLNLEQDMIYLYRIASDTNSMLRLPDNILDNYKLAAAEHFIGMGYVPMTHSTRQGNQTVSWYRGPLVPGKNSIAQQTIKTEVRSSDELYLFNKQYGMFDISYACAWELGRLLMLESKKTSLSLFNWKREQAHHKAIKEREKEYSHLPSMQDKIDLDLPVTVSEWFKDLVKLNHVPFNYLVPDERMLPVESIRFFQIDPVWIECLIDGAFSIGRTTENDHRWHQQLKEQYLSELSHGESGFIMRTEIVSGWQDLVIEAYDRDISNTSDVAAIKLKLLKSDCLSKNIRICIFDGILHTIDIHPKPEMLHFSINNGQDASDVLDITTLAGNKTSAQFAKFQLDSLVKARFIIN